MAAIGTPKTTIQDPIVQIMAAAAKIREKSLEKRAASAVAVIWRLLLQILLLVNVWMWRGGRIRMATGVIGTRVICP